MQLLQAKRAQRKKHADFNTTVRGLIRETLFPSSAKLPHAVERERWIVHCLLCCEPLLIYPGAAQVFPDGALDHLMSAHLDLYNHVVQNLNLQPFLDQLQTFLVSKKSASYETAVSKHQQDLNVEQTKLAEYAKLKGSGGFADEFARRATLFLARHHLPAAVGTSPEFVDMVCFLDRRAGRLSAAAIRAQMQSLSGEASNSVLAPLKDAKQAPRFTLLLDGGSERKTKMLLLLVRYITPAFDVVCTPIAFVPGTARSLTADVLRDSVVNALLDVPFWSQRLLGTMSDHATERATAFMLRDQTLKSTGIMEVFTCTLHLLDNGIKYAFKQVPAAAELLEPARQLLLRFIYRSGAVAFDTACATLNIRCCRLNRAGDTRWNSWRTPLGNLLAAFDCGVMAAIFDPHDPTAPVAPKPLLSPSRDYKEVRDTLPLLKQLHGVLVRIDIALKQLQSNALDVIAELPLVVRSLMAYLEAGAESEVVTSFKAAVRAYLLRPPGTVHLGLWGEVYALVTRAASQVDSANSQGRKIEAIVMPPFRTAFQPRMPGETGSQASTRSQQEHRQRAAALVVAAAGLSAKAGQALISALCPSSLLVDVACALLPPAVFSAPVAIPVREKELDRLADEYVRGTRDPYSQSTLEAELPDSPADQHRAAIELEVQKYASDQPVIVIRKSAEGGSLTTAEMWQRLLPLLPKLAELARCVFCLSAGNGATEREVKALHMVISKYRAGMSGATASKELLVLSGTRRGIFPHQVQWRRKEAPKRKRRRLSFAERRTKAAAAATGSVTSDSEEDDFEALEQEEVLQDCAEEGVAAMRSLLLGGRPLYGDDDVDVDLSSGDEEEIIPYDCE
jgi:nitrogen fixation protein